MGSEYKQKIRLVQVEPSRSALTQKSKPNTSVRIINTNTPPETQRVKRRSFEAYLQQTAARAPPKECHQKHVPQKEKDTDTEKVSEIFDKLKKQRIVLRNKAGDKDLKIISIYKVHGIELIYSRNKDDFKSYCKYLQIDFEKLQEDIDTMWKNVFGWKRYR